MSTLLDMRAAFHDATGRFEAYAGITVDQYLVLTALAQAGEEQYQAQLTKATGIDRTTISEVLARMHGAGFITQRRCTEDKRRLQAAMTKAGKAALRKGQTAERKLFPQAA
jgi:DNA-binding MarR family transcriptional regulator